MKDLSKFYKEFPQYKIIVEDSIGNESIYGDSEQDIPSKNNKSNDFVKQLEQIKTYFKLENDSKGYYGKNNVDEFLIKEAKKRNIDDNMTNSDIFKEIVPILYNEIISSNDKVDELSQKKNKDKSSIIKALLLISDEKNITFEESVNNSINELIEDDKKKKEADFIIKKIRSLYKKYKDLGGNTENFSRARRIS